MRQVLLRLSLAEPWAGWDGLTLGVGWLWLLIGVGWGLLRLSERGRKWDGDDSFLAGTWLVGGLGGLAFLMLRSPLPADAPATAGTIPLFGYGFFVLIGFLLGTFLARPRFRSLGWPADVAFRVGFWILFAGVVGARLFFLMQHGRDGFFQADAAGGASLKPLPGLVAHAVNLPDGGLVLYGGVIAGAIAFAVFCWREGYSPLRLADAVTPAVLVGIGFGRIGCLMNGCCYGDVCSLPWAITFPEQSPPYAMMVNRGFLQPGQTLPLHPTQIYSTISALLLAAATSLYFWRRSGDGSVLALGLIGYATHRFLVEFLRGDELGQLGTGLTISQLISIGMLALGVAIAVFVAVKRPKVATSRTPTVAA